MLKHFRQANKLQETVFLGILTIFCFSLSVFRYTYSDTKVFLFLNWNLFLAFIPWMLSSLLIIKPAIQKRKLIVVFVLISWILFFPNAPYILTDLFHLRLTSSMPVWFDLVLILSFAWTGMLFGFLSLWDIEKITGKFVRSGYIKIISVVLLFLGSFGIYIGRYLRWNSWDIITKPFQLLYDIGERIVNPFEHPRTWGMTLLMGIFLNMIYWSFRLISRK